MFKGLTLLLGMMVLSIPLIGGQVIIVEYEGARPYHRKPFSWYYPYPYKYYTPHGGDSSEQQCEWIYNAQYGYYYYRCW